ncbi:MAG: flagellin [bacterium]
MSVVVNTNLASAMVQKNLGKATLDLGNTMRKLSTGMRINSAGDDAAGLSLSEKLKSHIDSSEITKLNAQSGINMLQVAESDLSVIQNNLQRMRDLSIQAANGVYSTSERKMINQEFQERIKEIDRISQSSQFSDLFLLNGSLGPSGSQLKLQVGTYASPATTNTINIGAAFATTNTVALHLNTSNVTTVTSALASIVSLDAAISTVSSRRSLIGANINRLQSTVERIDVRKENLQASYSTIRDTDIAKETANLSRLQVLQQSGAMLLKQANQTTQLALQLLQ